MSFQAEMADMTARLQIAGKTVADLCREADIARSTWDRWASGQTLPNTRTWIQVTGAYKRLVQEAA